MAVAVLHPDYFWKCIHFSQKCISIIYELKFLRSQLQIFIWMRAWIGPIGKRSETRKETEEGEGEKKLNYFYRFGCARMTHLQPRNSISTCSWMKMKQEHRKKRRRRRGGREGGGTRQQLLFSVVFFWLPMRKGLGQCCVVHPHGDSRFADAHYVSDRQLRPTVVLRCPTEMFPVSLRFCWKKKIGGISGYFPV